MRHGSWSEPREFVLRLLQERRAADCASHQVYLIVKEGDFAALPPTVVGESRIDGRIVSFLGRERRRFHDVTGDCDVIVDQFLAIWPEETCQKAGVHTTLDNTYWQLVELNGKPVPLHEGQRETHIILRTQSNQLGGFGGCNKLTGRYEVDGDRVRFLDVAASGAACDFVADEQVFIDALSRVTHYLSVGESLQLRDDKGPIARLRAVYFR